MLRSTTNGGTRTRGNRIGCTPCVGRVEMVSCRWQFPLDYWCLLLQLLANCVCVRQSVSFQIASNVPSLVKTRGPEAWVQIPLGRPAGRRPPGRGQGSPSLGFAHIRHVRRGRSEFAIRSSWEAATVCVCGSNPKSARIVAGCRRGFEPRAGKHGNSVAAVHQRSWVRFPDSRPPRARAPVCVCVCQITRAPGLQQGRGVGSNPRQ